MSATPVRRGEDATVTTRTLTAAHEQLRVQENRKRAGLVERTPSHQKDEDMRLGLIALR
jgi:hypothetical protein